MKKIALLVHLAFLLGISAVTYGANYSVTLEDWKNHPDVKAVREIYDEIRAGIKDKNYKIQTKRYDVESASCATYPIKQETLVFDTVGQVRLYEIEKLGSHRESFSIERYYDSSGTIRFVFVDRLFSSVRIYLNNSGDVFWAIEHSNNKFTVFDSSNDDWEINPNIAQKAREMFQAKKPCPEITK